MTLLGTARDSATNGTAWHRACALGELEQSWGEAVLLGERQIAIFLVAPDELYAVDHLDPDTHAAVMARGIVGSRGVRPTVASPLHKQVYDLGTGECFTHPEFSLGTFHTRVVAGFVEIEIPV
jgi:nitrite reductase (NADH) small subunit